MAELIWMNEDYIGEHIELIGLIWEFEESEEFPHGLKYKMQATDIRTGETVRRYDNHNDAHAAKHHKHLESGKPTEAIENPFKDIKTDNTGEIVKRMKELWLQFKQEVKQAHED